MDGRGTSIHEGTPIHITLTLNPNPNPMLTLTLTLSLTLSLSLSLTLTLTLTLNLTRRGHSDGVARVDGRAQRARHLRTLTLRLTPHP